MVRILWLSHRDIRHKRAGGVEKAIFEISKRLVNKGHTVTWHSVSDGLTSYEEVISGIKIERSQNNILAHIMTPIVLKRLVPDVVIDDLGHAVPWFSERFYTKGTVSFWHLHKRSLKGQTSLAMNLILSGLETFYPSIYRNYTFITESKSSEDDLRKLGIKENRISVIPLGLNDSDFLDVKKSQVPKLVYFGGLRDYKRPWIPVYVIKEIRKSFPDSRLFIIGEGPSLPNLKKLVAEQELTDVVVFTGRLGEKDLKREVGSSWVNLHSSITEGFGLSIIEASALGTPTVAFSVPGVSEAVVNNENGLLAKNGDFNEYVKLTKEVVSSFSPDWISKSIKIAKNYSWDLSANSWEQHLKDVYASSK